MVDVRKDRRPVLKDLFSPSLDVSLSFVGDPGLTEQSHKDDCDVNVILARYAKTGALPGMIKENPQYGDFSTIASYQDSLNVVIDAEHRFASLDAHVRKRFGNDPAQFVAFAMDPSNVDEMIKLGLASKHPDAASSIVPPGAAPSADSGESSKASGASKDKS